FDCFSGAIERSIQMDGHSGCPLRIAYFMHRHQLSGLARVVDQDIGRPAVLVHDLKKMGDGSRAAHVGRYDDRLGLLRLNEGSGLASPGVIDLSDHHTSAFRREPYRGRSSNTGS